MQGTELTLNRHLNHWPLLAESGRSNRAFSWNLNVRYRQKLSFSLDEWQLSALKPSLS